MIRRWAILKRLLDKPTTRSSHTRITPLGGGIAIVTCWYLVITFLLAFYPKLMPEKLFLSLLPGLLLLYVGIRDDAKQLSPWVRLLTQTVVAGTALFFLGGLNEINFGIGIWHSPIIINIFTFFVFLWFINLFNFYDGIDGNLGLESIAICLMSLIFVPFNPLIFLIACLGGFLLWNWQKAKIFMGDAGSTFLGFNFAVFGIYFQNEFHTSILLWLLICGVALFDTTFTLIRRIFYKENVLEPHQNQIFQRLVLSGFSHQQVVFIQQGINIFIFIGVWYASKNTAMILPITAGVLLILFAYAYWAEKRYPFVKKNTKNRRKEKTAKTA
jgi:Fuc2NAc and GlcNAc transferase